MGGHHISPFVFYHKKFHAVTVLEIISMGMMCWSFEHTVLSPGGKQLNWMGSSKVQLSASSRVVAGLLLLALCVQASTFFIWMLSYTEMHQSLPRVAVVLRL